MMRNRDNILAAGCILLVSLLAGCGESAGQDCELTRPPAGEPFEKLSDYCFFDGEPSTQTSGLSEGVVPYNVRSKLYSDHSDKFRFIVLPDGETIDYDETEMWSFPDGTIIIKTFYYPHDARNPSDGRRLLETRLMIKWDGEWRPQVYLWNNEQTQAKRHLIGKDRQVEWIDEQGDDRSVNYRVPGVTACKSCHSVDNNIELLGPRTRQLNRMYRYADGTRNQLVHFNDKGMLAPELQTAPQELPRLADPKDESLSIETRARAYLEGNCAHCHTPNGPASNSGLFLSVETESKRQLGVCKQPVAAGGGTGGFEYDIKPGHPDESIMIYRVKSSEPGVKMPELPLRTVDEFGASLLSDWIAQMEPTGCE
jgi:uncharacterized repeat protein (TIGR03806 family)